jgi:hypothetical protein
MRVSGRGSAALPLPQFEIVTDRAELCVPPELLNVVSSDAIVELQIERLPSIAHWDPFTRTLNAAHCSHETFNKDNRKE